MRSQFAFYKSFDDVFQDLSDKQKLEFMNTLLDVQFLRIKIEDVAFKDVILKHIWNAQKHSLEKSISGYLESQKNTKVKNPFLGCYDESFLPSQTPSEGNSKEEQVKEKVKEKEKVKDKEKYKEKIVGFKKPTLDEIQNRISEMNYQVDAVKFLNYYESNGWKVGRNKMKCWKSALTTWNSNNDTRQQKQATQSFKQQDAQRTDESVERYYALKEKGFDVRKPNYGMPIENFEDAEVIEYVK